MAKIEILTLHRSCNHVLLCNILHFNNKNINYNNIKDVNN